MARFPRPILIYVSAVAALGVALLAYSLWRYPLTGDLTRWLLFGGFTILMSLSDRYGLQFRLGTRVHVDTIPLFAGVLLFNPLLAMLIGGLGRALGRVRRGADLLERTFNIGQTLLYTGVSALLLRVLAPEAPWLPGGWPSWAGVIGAAAAMFFLNSGMVAGAVSLQTRGSFWRIWVGATPAMLVEYGIMYAYALMTALLVAPHPWALVLVVVSSVVIFLVLDRSLRMEALQKKLADENAALAVDLSKQAGQLREAYVVIDDALDAKNRMVQNVSHELRTPLVSILGYSEALQEGISGDLTTDQLSLVEPIIRNAKAMNRVVNDLISLQALDRRQLQLSELALCDLLQGCLANFDQRAQAARIDLRLECSDDLPLLHADGAQLEQAFDHLLDNAIKFSPNGGPVTMRATRTVSGGVEITVSDRGIGIPAEALPRIYRRFYQVDGSRTRRFGGQGLGLAIVKRIVELHGGSIRAESQVGVGTTFFVTLPVEIVPEETRTASLD